MSFLQTESTTAFAKPFDVNPLGDSTSFPKQREALRAIGLISPITAIDSALNMEETDSICSDEELIKEISKGNNMLQRGISVSTADSSPLGHFSELQFRTSMLEVKSQSAIRPTPTEILTPLSGAEIQLRTEKDMKRTTMPLRRGTTQLLDGPLMEFFKRIGNSRRKTEAAAKAVSTLGTDCQQIHPIFNSISLGASNYTFKNSNQTVVHKNNPTFSPLYSNEPLPTSGRYKFSIRVTSCSKEHPKLYVGIVSGALKGKDLRYRAGSYFMSAFSTHSYLNGLQIVREAVLPKIGQKITVIVDRDLGWIRFEVEGERVLEGRLNLARLKVEELYACICLGEPNGTVSVI